MSLFRHMEGRRTAVFIFAHTYAHIHKSDNHPARWTRIVLMYSLSCSGPVHPLRTDQHIPYHILNTIPPCPFSDRSRGQHGRKRKGKVIIYWGDNWCRVFAAGWHVANQCLKHSLDLILSSTTNFLQQFNYILHKWQNLLAKCSWHICFVQKNRVTIQKIYTIKDVK